MNVSQKVTIRFSDRKDTGFLVPLFTESSGGVWPAVWKALAKTGESSTASAKRYLENSENNLSIANTVIAETGGVRVGAMTCYRELKISSSVESSTSQLSLPSELERALKPYSELSDPDSLFISEICLLPESRGNGVGTRLLDYARMEAIQAGLATVSLRVFSENTGAVRLYERFGFTLVDKRAVLSHPDIQATGEVYFYSCIV